jgi:hypothetical protein
MMRHPEKRGDNGRFAGYPETLPVVIPGTISDRSDVQSKCIVQPKRLLLRLLGNLLTSCHPRGLDQHVREQTAIQAAQIL